MKIRLARVYRRYEMITAQFNDSFPPIADGVALGVKNYALWLNRKYGRAYAVVPEFPGYTDDEEFPVIRYKSIPYYPRKPYRIGLHGISFEAKRILSDISLDIVHARTPFSSGAFAHQIAREKNIPIVATFHSQYYYDIKEQVLSETITRGLLKRIADFYESTDAVWTVNNKTAATLREYGYRGDIDIMGNGTDFKMPANYEKIRAVVGREYNIKPCEFMLMYTGQLVWHKNLRLIVEGLHEIKRKGHAFKMFFIGKGDAEAELIELIQQLDLRENVILTGQIDNRTKLRDLYARSDLFLFPSIYDTFGIVVREAAALKTPCVLVAGSNASEGIEDMVNGFLCKNDTESFAGKIMEIMENPELLASVADRAMRTIPESWEQIVDRAYSKYEDIIRDYSIRKNSRSIYRNPF
ncbi:MAG: glycosyltransferase [Clostridia bacterium]